MKECFFSRPLAAGLCAYLLGLELSVDRSLNAPTSLLRDYCNESRSPALREVLAKLQLLAEEAGLPVSPLDGRGRRRTWLAMAVLSGWLQWYVRAGFSLRTSEVGLVSAPLLSLSDALLKHSFVAPEIFVPIRLNLCGASDLLLRRIPPGRTRGMIGRVEHLNQNPTLKTLSLEEIAGRRDWLDRVHARGG